MPCSSSTKRFTALAILLTGLVGIGSAFAVYHHNRGPAPLTLGDGRTGPADMVWIAGGDFVMAAIIATRRPTKAPRIAYA
jgi:hypothetical protein